MGTKFPIVPEASRRGNRRQRKKRNSLKFNKSKLKAMDDSSETSSTNNDRSPKLEVHKEKTKVYEPLQIFTNLALKEDEIYRELELHVLTLEQLKLYGFPIESPDRSGHIILSNNLVSGATERHCCRCNSLFEIDSDGQYQATSLCQYHPKKQTPFRHGVQYLGEYPCCNGNFLSKGCITCPFHVSVESCLHDNEFAKARQKRHLNEVTSRTVYAVDCEMLFTTAGMEVAKVGIVGVDGLTVYESHVLPQNEILDYNTLYSGITEKDLNGVTTTLKDVQTYLQKLLNKNSILIGHALDNDLKALRFVHEKIVDTSVVFPHPYNKKYKKSLKALAKEFLNKHIQQSEDGHDPIEDARTCMDLMLNKIRIDSQNCLPLSQDENHNAILQNIEQTELHSNTFARQSWIYQPNNYNVPCFDTFRGNHYTHVLTQNYSYPQQQKQCVY